VGTGTHLKATKRHLPYGITGITQLPCTQFTYPGGMEGWVDLGDWWR